MQTPQSDPHVSTQEITIEGHTRPVHYTMFSDEDIQVEATQLEDALRNYGLITVEDNQITINHSYRETDIIPKLPLATILYEIATTTPFEATDSSPVNTAYIPTQRTKWKHTEYTAEEPTLADVVAALLCVKNATIAHNTLENNSTHLSDQTYQTVLGMAMAMRDVYFPNTPRSPLRPAAYSNPEIRLHNALTQTFGITIPDTALHALLIYQTNTDTALSVTNLSEQDSIFNQTITEELSFHK